MKFDNYCIAAIVLVLFLLYIDSTNNIEGFGAELDQVASEPLAPYGGQLPKQRQQETQPVGMKPQKVVMEPPASMSRVMGMVEGAGSPLASLDDAFAVLTPQAVPTQILADVKPFGSRVGGPGNAGNEALGDAAPGAQFDSVAPTGSPSDSSKPTKTLEVHMVYAPWCGWSKKALPAFEQLEQEFHGTQMGEYQVSVVKHDSDTPEGKAVAKEHDVKGFPTHFVIKDGQKMEANGREFEQLASQIKQLTA